MRSTDLGQNGNAQNDSTISASQGGIFIGEDPENGDNIIRAIPPRQPEQQQTHIPYIIPEVAVPWQSQPGQPYPPQPPRPPYPPDGNWGGNSGNYPGNYPPLFPGQPTSPALRPDQTTPPSVRPSLPTSPALRPGQTTNPTVRPGQPTSPALRPSQPAQPPTWLPPAWSQPGQPLPGYNQGGPFVYQPGRELPRSPRGNSPYAPLGPSGPIIVPPSGR